MWLQTERILPKLIPGGDKPQLLTAKYVIIFDRKISYTKLNLPTNFAARFNLMCNKTNSMAQESHDHDLQPIHVWK
jgi:hypothetical protein